MKQKAGCIRQKQAWPEIGYLVCLNLSAAFPFTWKAKQSGGCVRDHVRSSLQGLCGLEDPGEKHYDWNMKKCLLQKTQPRVPYVLAVFRGYELDSWICRMDSVSKRPALAQLLLSSSSSTCGLRRKSDSLNACNAHRFEDNITAFTLWLVFIVSIPTQYIKNRLYRIHHSYIVKYKLTSSGQLMWCAYTANIKIEYFFYVEQCNWSHSVVEQDY